MNYTREKIVQQDTRRKQLCQLICETLKKGTPTKEGVIGGINFPAEYEHHNDIDSHKWSPRIGYFGTVVVDEPTQKTDYDPDSPEVLNAWITHAESPKIAKLPFPYQDKEVIPSPDGSYIIYIFEECEDYPSSIGVGDEESVLWEKEVSYENKEWELKKLRLMLPIMGVVLLEKEFHSAEPE